MQSGERNHTCAVMLRAAVVWAFCSNRCRQGGLLTRLHSPRALIVLSPLNASLLHQQRKQESSAVHLLRSIRHQFPRQLEQGSDCANNCACSATRPQAAGMSRSLQRVFGRSGRSFHQELGSLPNLTMKKEEMHRLPKYALPSSVILIDSKRDETRCKTAIRKALNARVLGFDTESPIPESGCAPYAPSIVQISTEEEALVWKVSGLWHLPDPLREILECDAVKASCRAGLSFHSSSYTTPLRPLLLAVLH